MSDIYYGFYTGVTGRNDTGPDQSFLEKYISMAGLIYLPADRRYFCFAPYDRKSDIQQWRRMDYCESHIDRKDLLIVSPYGALHFLIDEECLTDREKKSLYKNTVGHPLFRR